MLSRKYATPPRLLRKCITSAEFVEELAAHRIEPWSDDWDRTSLIAALLWNANGGKPKRDSEWFHPGRLKRQSPEEIQWRLNLMFGVMKRQQDGKRR